MDSIRSRSNEEATTKLLTDIAKVKSELLLIRLARRENSLRMKELKKTLKHNKREINHFKYQLMLLEKLKQQCNIP